MALKLYLAEWRDFLGLTTQQLSARSNIPVTSIIKLEMGKMKFTQDHLEQLGEALDTDSNALLFPPGTRFLHS